MMKNLLKKAALFVALSASAFSFAQSNIVITDITQSVDTADGVDFTLTVTYTSSIDAAYRGRWQDFTQDPGGNIITQIGPNFDFSFVASTTPQTVDITYNFPAGTDYSVDFTNPNQTYRLFLQTQSGENFVDIMGASPNVSTFGGGGRNILATFDIVEDPSLSVSDFNKSDISASIYPNPTSDILNIGVDSETYTVVDLTGATVLEVAATGTLNVEGLSSGIYFLVTDAGTTRFVKQ